MNPFIQRKQWHTCQLLSSSAKGKSFCEWWKNMWWFLILKNTCCLCSLSDISPVKIWISSYGLLCWTGYFLSPTYKKTTEQNASLSSETCGMIMWFSQGNVHYEWLHCLWFPVSALQWGQGGAGAGDNAGWDVGQCSIRQHNWYGNCWHHSRNPLVHQLVRQQQHPAGQRAQDQGTSVSYGKGTEALNDLVEQPRGVVDENLAAHRLWH